MSEQSDFSGRRDFLKGITALGVSPSIEAITAGIAQADVSVEGDIEAEKTVAAQFATDFTAFMEERGVMEFTDRDDVIEVYLAAIDDTIARLQLDVSPSDILLWLFKRGQFFNSAWPDNEPWFTEIADIEAFIPAQEPATHNFFGKEVTASIEIAVIDDDRIGSSGATTPDNRIFINAAMITRDVELFNQVYADQGLSIDVESRTQMVRLNEAWHGIFYRLFPDLRTPEVYDQPLNHPVMKDGDEAYTVRHADEFLSDCIVLEQFPEKLAYLCGSLADALIGRETPGYVMSINFLFNEVTPIFEEKGGLQGILEDAELIVNNTWVPTANTFGVGKAIYAALSEEERKTIRTNILKKGDEIKHMLEVKYKK